MPCSYIFGCGRFDICKEMGRIGYPEVEQCCYFCDEQMTTLPTPFDVPGQYMCTCNDGKSTLVFGNEEKWRNDNES